MSGIAVIAFAAAFTSCSKSTDLYDAGAVQQREEQKKQETIANNIDQAKAQYAAAFEKAFGKVGSNVDWGFSSQVAGTRTTQKEYHNWPSLGLSMPTPLTDEEKADVTNFFATTEFSDKGIALNWTEYYVEWVSNVSETSAYRNEGNQPGDMGNVSITFDKIGVESTSQWADNGYEDIADWNASNHPTYYMYETVGTGKFRAWVSYASKWTTKFTIQEYKGNYYVGFDIDVTKDSDGRIDLGQKTLGHYNDYIIRLVPGKGQPIPNTHLYRVIAEDLNAQQASDFDFNDVVFDVVKSENNKTTLRLIACGGIYKLTVAGVEVHEKFGQKATNGLYPMINTGANADINGLDPVEFDIDGTYNTPELINNIEIRVWKPGTGEDGIPLTAEKGKAACKILVDDSFGVVPEKQGIGNEYGLFSSYVQGGWDPIVNGKWWLKK